MHTHGVLQLNPGELKLVSAAYQSNVCVGKIDLGFCHIELGSFPDRVKCLCLCEVPFSLIRCFSIDLYDLCSLYVSEVGDLDIHDNLIAGRSDVETRSLLAEITSFNTIAGTSKVIQRYLPLESDGV
jgi:hypothetical protein